MNVKFNFLYTNCKPKQSSFRICFQQYACRCNKYLIVSIYTAIFSIYTYISANSICIYIYVCNARLDVYIHTILSVYVYVHLMYVCVSIYAYIQ